MLYFSLVNATHARFQRMFPDMLLTAQGRIFAGTDDVKFVGIEPVNDTCIKLDIKGKDISSGKFFFYYHNTVFMYSSGRELFKGCTGGPDGFYNWLKRHDVFQKYFTGNEEEQADVLELCKEKLVELELPEVLHNAVEYTFENRMNPEQLKEYFNEVTADENAYIMLDTVSRDQFEISSQFVLLTTESTFLATKFFSVKKDSEGVERFGFGLDEDFSERDRPQIQISNGSDNIMMQMIGTVMSHLFSAQMDETNSEGSNSEENSGPVIVPSPNPKLAAYEQEESQNNVEVTVDVVPVSENSNNEDVTDVEGVVQENTEDNTNRQDSEDEEDNVEFVRTLFTEEYLEQLEFEAVRNEEEIVEETTTQVEENEEEVVEESNGEEVVEESNGEKETIQVEENAEQVINENNAEQTITQTKTKKEAKNNSRKTKGLIIALFVLSILIAAGLVGLSFFYTQKKVVVDDI